jgi:type II secretory pathway pseudopilin PulG
VVIAIISILAGILFPVFSQAREKAKRISCESNLRQIGLGFAQYTQDFDETYPCDTSDQQLWQGEHFRWTIMPYLGINQQKAGAAVPADSEAATSAFAQILTCPSDTATGFNGTSYFYSMAFYVAPKDFSILSTVPPPSPPWLGIFSLIIPCTPQSLSKVISPSQKILAGEWADNHDKVYSHPQGFYPAPGLDTSRAYVFADGHVKYLAMSKLNVGYSGVREANTTIGGVGGVDIAQ